MKSAAALKYDPFQAELGPPNSSALQGSIRINGDPAQETARHYGEKYWYPTSLPDKQLNQVMLTNTGIVQAPSSGISANVNSNVSLSMREQQAPPNVFFRKTVYAQPHSRFEVLQKWEGFVLDVLSDSFTARLIDLTQKGSDEEGEFALDEIDAADKELLNPGAIFYWYIGYSDSSTGRARVSVIRFRRLPIWRSEELQRARREAERLSGLLEWK